jgi:hypothetical protein
MTNMQRFFHLLLLSLAGLVPAAGAQIPKQFPGYIITLDGDTVRGTIDRQKNWQYQRQIRFTGVDGQKKEFKPGQIVAYYFEHNAYFVSRQITLFDGDNKRFMREVVRGHVSLYEGYDEQRQLQYFLHKDGRTIALNKYRLTSQLGKVVPECPTLKFDENAIRRNTYRYAYASLVPTIMEYNRCAWPDEPARIMRRPDTLWYRLGAKAGAGISWLSMQGSIVPQVSGHEASTSTPGLGTMAGLFITLTKPKARLSAQMELLASYRAGSVGYTGRTSAYRSQGEITYRAVHAQLPIFLKYHFQRAHFGPFMAFGVQLATQLSLGSSRVEETNLDRNLTYSSIPLDEYVSTNGLLAIGWDFELAKAKSLGLEVRALRTLGGQFFVTGTTIVGQAGLVQLMLSYRW